MRVGASRRQGVGRRALRTRARSARESWAPVPGRGGQHGDGPLERQYQPMKQYLTYLGTGGNNPKATKFGRELSLRPLVSRDGGPQQIFHGLFLSVVKLMQQGIDTCAGCGATPPL